MLLVFYFLLHIYLCIMFLSCWGSLVFVRLLSCLVLVGILFRLLFGMLVILGFWVLHLRVPLWYSDDWGILLAGDYWFGLGLCSCGSFCCHFLFCRTCTCLWGVFLVCYCCMWDVMVVCLCGSLDLFCCISTDVSSSICPHSGSFPPGDVYICCSWSSLFCFVHLEISQIL